MITKEELQAAGWEKKSWMDDVIVEMRKHLRVGRGETDRAYLAVVFFEVERAPEPRVEIVAGQCRLKCPYIQTLERLNLLYELLADPALVSTEPSNQIK